MHDEVRLVMPADPEFLRLARVTAMGLASRLSFSIDDIEDVRIAIDELVFALIGIRGREGTIQIDYALLPQGLQVIGTGVFPGPEPTPALTELSELILNAVTDEHHLSSDDDVPTFRLLKRRSGA